MLASSDLSGCTLLVRPAKKITFPPMGQVAQREASRLFSVALSTFAIPTPLEHISESDLRQAGKRKKPPTEHLWG